MKLLRKKNGQWFTVSVAIGGLLLGVTSMDVSASEAPAESEEFSELLDPPSETGVSELSSKDEPQVESQEPVVEDQEDSQEEPVIEEVESVTDEASQEGVGDSGVTVEEDMNVAGDQVNEPETNTDSSEEDSAETQETEEPVKQKETSNDSEEDYDPEANEVEDSNPDEENTEESDAEPVESTEENSVELEDVTSAEEEAVVEEDINRNELVNVDNTWSEGYRGEGQVVAIIDSGLYIDHSAFQTVSDIDRAKYKSEEELNRAKEAAGIDYGRWFNEKIIFGHNYNDVNDELVEEDFSSHGTHVADSAVGNPSEPLNIGTEENPNAQFHALGVAPEAQLMFMRVFSDENMPGSTSEYLYIQAIEDAVALGAQSINLSLGAPGGSQYNASGALNDAIHYARQSGVSVVMAAGNEDSFGSGHSNPLATNPDYGVVGTPSTSRDSISVAAVESVNLVNEVLTLQDEDGNEINLNINIVENGGRDVLESPEYAGQSFEYEYVGLGSDEEIVEVDLTDKFAVISRGDLTFSEKAQNARQAGATGVVIFNNVDDGTLVNMAIEGVDDFPIFGVNFESGQELIANQDTHRLSFTGSTLQFANPDAGSLTDFTSWGLSADGELKPDLAAPGGNVYGAVNDDSYQSMSGTSMASPHVAGAVALLTQKLPDLYEGIEGQELTDLVKALLMSSARPHYNTEQGAYTSPRQQGAGLIDVDNALNSGVFLTGVDGYPSISLRNVGDQFEFEVNVYNISDEDKIFDITTQLASDAVEDSLFGPVFSLKPRHLKDVPEGQVTVAANSFETVTIQVDAREFTEALLTEMPNGYYLEGFVSFGTDEDASLASIPFVGFRGDFANLDVVEKPVYEYGFDLSEDFSDAPFYFVDTSTGALTSNYTSLITINDNYVVTLGEDSVSSLDSDEEFVFAISPDGDGAKDFVGFQGVFLRNYEDFEASVYYLNDLGEEELVWISDVAGSGIKNHFSSNPARPKSSIVSPSLWMGVDQDGNIVTEGQYRYELSFRSQVPGSLSQLMSFDVHVSTTTPEATGADYDEETGVLSLRDVNNLYPGLNPYRTRIVSGEEPDEMMLALGLATDTRQSVYMNGRDDYTFDIPEGLDLYSSTTILYLEDYAGNSSEVLLSDLLHGDSGVVEFKLTDAETGEDLTGAGLRVRIRDAEGNIVAGDRLEGNNDQNVRRLPYGSYTAEVFLINEEYFELVDGIVQPFEVSENNSWQTVEFLVNYIERVDFRVNLNQTLPEGSEIILVDETGEETLVPVTSYVNDVHQVRVPAGEYTLVVNLPEGFTSEQNGLVLAIDSNNSTIDVVVERIPVDKTELAELIEEAQQVDPSTISTGDALVLDLVLSNAESVYNDEEALQSEVDNATEALATHLENLGVFDPLASEREEAKAEIATFDLLTETEFENYNQQVDTAETSEQINQVVGDARTRQTELEEELATAEALADTKESASEIISALDPLSGEEKAGFQAQVEDADTVEEVDAVVADAVQANEEAAERQAEEEARREVEQIALNGAKSVANNTLSNLSNLTDEQKADFQTQVDEAGSVDAVNAVVTEALQANEKAAEQAAEQAAEEAEQEALNTAKELANDVVQALDALSDEERAAYLDQISNAQTLEEVREAVLEAVEANNIAANQNSQEPEEPQEPEVGGEGDDTEDPPTQENSDETSVEEPETDESTDDTSSDGGVTNPTEESESNNSDEANESEAKSESVDADEDQIENVSGEVLPSTATNAWILGLLGTSSLLAGAGIKRKED